MKPFLSFVLFVLACACVPADALAAPLSEEELEFLQIEAWRGDADALFALGEMHEKGESGFKADKMVALCCYLPAARKGHKGAISRVKALGGNRYLPKEFRDDEHAQSEDIYIVKRGDTLRGIARTLGVSVSALEKANPEAFPNPFVGQKLKIPSPSTFVSSSVAVSSSGLPSVADCGNGVQMEFVHIPAGTFMMGSPRSEEDRDSDESQVRVTISRPFYLGKYEVTQAQWRAVMGTDPSKLKGDDLPVEMVSWYDANAFCERLTSRERAAGRLPQNMKFTLPTEAQWEYACRAGTTTRFYTGNSESDLARAAWYEENALASWYEENSKTHAVGQKAPNAWGGSRTFLMKGSHAVGQKAPNAWGLYDMHGNVWEWCADYHNSELTAGTDPCRTTPGSGKYGSLRVRRGGSWFDPVRDCRSARRGCTLTGFCYDDVGFRVCAVQEH